MPFINDMDYTYEAKGAKRVAMNQLGPALYKRQCTAQVCFRPVAPEPPPSTAPEAERANFFEHVAPQPAPCIIFRGLGKQISQAEKDAYPAELVVLWQPKAWADRPVARDWVSKVIKPLVEADRAAGVADENSRYMLIQDNLDAQCQPEYLEMLRELGVDDHKVRPNKTDQVQPIDRGFGRLLKVYIGQECDEWLEDNDNLCKWEANQLTASDRRMLIATWLCSAHAKVRCSPPPAFSSLQWPIEAHLPPYTPFYSPIEPLIDSYTHTHIHTPYPLQVLKSDAARKYFEHAGGLLTADGSGDDLIKLEGVPAGEKFSWVDDENYYADSSEPMCEYEPDGEVQDPNILPDAVDDEEDVSGGTVEELDEEDDGDPNLPPAECVAPSGFSLRADRPSESLLHVGTAEHATLRGQCILYNWPVVGWCFGVIETANTNGRRKVGGEVVNAIVFYEIDGEHGAHVLSAAQHGETWVLLQREGEEEEGGEEEEEVMVDE
jgi:hypothetical protein